MVEWIKMVTQFKFFFAGTLFFNFLLCGYQHSTARIAMAEARASPFVAKEWLLDDPDTAFADVQTILRGIHADTASASKFKQRLAVAMIFHSNRLERSIPTNMSEVDTVRILSDCYDKDDSADDPPKLEWEVEGENVGERAREKLHCQIVQHMRALKYAMSRTSEPLTVDMVTKMHWILTHGAVDSSGIRIKNGEFRDHPCHAGTHFYPEGEPAVLEACLKRIVDVFNDDARKIGDNPTLLIEAPTRLFYRVITLHPFQNGNGRLCRLLLTWALMHLGVPFPVLLTTGHSKARQHYMRGIMKARQGSMKELNTMTLMSVESVLKNY